MPKQTHAFEDNGPKRLEISWKGFWRNVTIHLDGETIGTIPGRKQLSAGQEFLLPDGSSLKLQLVRTLTAYELRVLRDGKPLPGSASAPESRVRLASGVVFFIAGMNIVLGLITSVLQIEFLQSMGMGLASVIFGFGFLVLGYFVRRRSLAALVIAIAVFALDGILSFMSSLSPGYIIPRLFLLVPLVQGIGAIRALRKREGPTNRKTKVIVGVAMGLLVLCVGTSTAGILVARAVIERVVITDPSKVSVAAKSIAEYDLPPGYHEEMVMDFFLFRALMIARTDSSSEGSRGPIFALMQTSTGQVDQDEFNEQMRAAIEQQWQTANFVVQQAATEKVIICGQEVTLLLYEGIDEEGNASRQITSSWFEVNGKPTGLMVIGFTEDWDQAHVDAFIQSIR